MGKNQNSDHTGQKSYSTTSEASHVFPPELSFFDRHSERIICRQPLQCDFFCVLTFFLMRVQEI